MSNKIISPISNSRYARDIGEIDRSRTRLREREAEKTYKGKVIGVSSPDEGFMGSGHDPNRDFFKFRVFFEEDKRIEMVTPNLSKEEFYEKVGYCEEGYLGMDIVCKYPGTSLPDGSVIGLRGVVDIGDVSRERISRSKVERENPNIDANEDIYKTNENPLEKSMGFISSGFSGIIDGASNYLISKMYS